MEKLTKKFQKTEQFYKQKEMLFISIFIMSLTYQYAKYDKIERRQGISNLNQWKKNRPGFICGIDAKYGQQKKGLLNNRNKL